MDTQPTERDHVVHQVGEENTKFAEEIATYIRKNNDVVARLLTNSATFSYLNEDLTDDDFLVRASTHLLDLIAEDPRTGKAMVDVLKILKAKGEITDVGKGEEEQEEGEEEEEEDDVVKEEEDDGDYTDEKNKKSKKNKGKKAKATKGFEEKEGEIEEDKTTPAQHSGDAQKDPSNIASTQQKVAKEEQQLKAFKTKCPLAKVGRLGIIRLLNPAERNYKGDFRFTSVDLENELRKHPELMKVEEKLQTYYQHGSYKIELAWNTVHMLLSEESQGRLQEILAARALFRTTGDVGVQESWRAGEPPDLTVLIVDARTAMKLAEETARAEYKTLSHCVSMYLQMEFVITKMDPSNPKTFDESYVTYVTDRVETRAVYRSRLKEFVIRATWNLPIGKMSRGSAEWERSVNIYRWMLALGQRLFNLCRGLGGMGWLLLCPPRMHNKLVNIPSEWFQAFRDAAQTNQYVKELGSSLTDNVAKPLTLGQDPQVQAFHIVQRNARLGPYTWPDLLAKTTISADNGTIIVTPMQPGFIEESELHEAEHKTLGEIADAAGQHIDVDAQMSEAESLDENLESAEEMEIT